MVGLPLAAEGGAPCGSLVVDDELSMREYLEILIAAVGYTRCAPRRAPPPAIRCCERAAWTWCISDMKLGADSGLRVLKAARALRRRPR